MADGSSEGPAAGLPMAWASSSSSSARRSRLPPGVSVGTSCTAIGLYAGMRRPFKALLLATRERSPAVHVKFVADAHGREEALYLPELRRAFVDYADITPYSDKGRPPPTASKTRLQRKEQSETAPPRVRSTKRGKRVSWADAMEPKVETQVRLTRQKTFEGATGTSGRNGGRLHGGGGLNGGRGLDGGGVAHGGRRSPTRSPSPTRGRGAASQRGLEMSRAAQGACDALSGEVCHVCGGHHSRRGNEMLLCDGEGCGRGYHLRCFEVPLKRVPDDSWLCARCVLEERPIAAYFLEFGGSSSVRIGNEFQARARKDARKDESEGREWKRISRTWMLLATYALVTHTHAQSHTPSQSHTHTRPTYTSRTHTSHTRSHTQLVTHARTLVTHDTCPLVIHGTCPLPTYTTGRGCRICQCAPVPHTPVPHSPPLESLPPMCTCRRSCLASRGAASSACAAPCLVGSSMLSSKRRSPWALRRSSRPPPTKIPEASSSSTAMRCGPIGRWRPWSALRIRGSVSSRPRHSSSRVCHWGASAGRARSVSPAASSASRGGSSQCARSVGSCASSLMRWGARIGSSCPRPRSRLCVWRPSRDGSSPRLKCLRPNTAHVQELQHRRSRIGAALECSEGDGEAPQHKLELYLSDLVELCLACSYFIAVNGILFLKITHADICTHTRYTLTFTH